MPDRSRLSDSSRAEARRRARMAARGDAEEPEYEDEADSEPAPRPSLMSRLLPTAPPLAGKPDPLAGFDYDGPFRRLAIALYLLARNPVAWLVPAALWVVLAQLPVGDSTLALIGSIGQYVVLIAAGWIGWQRPWLYGSVAGGLAFLGVVAVTFARLATGLEHLQGPAGNAAQIASGVAFETLLYAVIGAVAGWYGGYLRRRLADQRPSQQATRPRRR